MKKVSILVHGYNKNKRDMKSLSMNLKKLGHECYCMDLPLTFNTIDEAYTIFVKEYKKIEDKLDKNLKINLVGHSTGGLLIRKFISQYEDVSRIGDCVLISTPNEGSRLADIAYKYINPFCKVFKTLDSLTSKNVKKIAFERKRGINIGAIAGNNNNLLMGSLLKDENDGRVRVNSVFHESLDDFIVLYYGHKEIHHRQRTAEYVDNFIENKNFKLSIKGRL